LENGLTSNRSEAASTALTVEDLVDMFENAEDATLDARKLSERDRDYTDGKQLSSDELKALKKRGQPEVIINRIKRKVEFLKGYEQSQRVDPRALPRTPKHEADADGVQQALRYVADDQRFDQMRSRVWDNLIVEGMGGYRVGVKDGYDGLEVTIRRFAWDRMFYDPHASEPDFSDAGYLGGVIWMDYDEAVAKYGSSPDALDALETTLDSASLTDTYDDKPKFRVWADKKRRRVRVVQIWIKRLDQWYFAEFTKGGILLSGASPHKTDKDESDCELIFGSCYINRDNERYGIVREMISPQDEINKRRSKALHLLNVNQTILEEGAVADVEKFRAEKARADGTLIVNPGFFDKIKTETRDDLAAAHLQLSQEAKNEIDMMAGNIALQGNALQKSAASGKAIIASQQGGAMEIAAPLDALRDLDVRVYRAVWYRIRQYWTAEKWVRVTDDENNVKWLGLNVEPQRAEMLKAQNPDKIEATVGSIAELDCDIIIDDAPDGLTPQLEQFQTLVELKKYDANNELPFRAIVAASPNLKNRERVLAEMDKAKEPPPEVAQLQQRMKQLEMAMAEAKVADTQASAQLKQAQAQAAMMPDPQQPAQGDPGPTEAEWRETMASAEQKQSAAVLNYARADQIGVETMLAPQQLAQQASNEQAKISAMQNRQTQGAR
jgi:hypothetical protein